MTNEPLKIAYLGPPGTFSQAAVINRFGSDCEQLPCGTIDDVFTALEQLSADYGVVPIENSTEGSVNNTQDCLIDTELSIVGEEVIDIEHNLLVPNRSGNMTVKVIASHKQSLAQCRDWIRSNCPGVELLECTSNADAASRVNEEKGIAAIAGSLAAKAYNLRVLARGIQDKEHNRTRFILLQREKAPPSGFDKTSILVYTANEPGALFRLLEPFQRLQISLSKIDSRPSKKEAWAYVFFIDFEGHVEDKKIVMLFDRLKDCTEEIKVLGSYPAQNQGALNQTANVSKALRSSVKIRQEGTRVAPLKSKTVGIIGLGMIGGSIALGLRRTFPDLDILAADPNTESLQAAKNEGTLTRAGSVEEVIASADLIILAVPPLALPKHLSKLQQHGKPEAVFTDVSSVKSHITANLADFETEFSSRFVPGHPIAGSEKSGYVSAKPELFERRRVILTPHADNSVAAVAEVHLMWRALGAEVLGMTSARHDEVLAATSHLPHLLAYSIVDLLLHQDASEEVFRYAAGGFADFSRIASSNAQMWSDIFVANSDATDAILTQYMRYLGDIKQLIEHRQGSDLKLLFQRAKDARDNFIVNHRNLSRATTMTNYAKSYLLRPGGSISGALRVPGDKSMSHRAVIFGSLAKGVTRVEGFLEGEDAINTVSAFREMGVTIVGPDSGKLTIYGVGMQGLKAPRAPLYMGNSGTAMRLLAGLMAAQPFESRLIGDESLSVRPMGRIVKPLTEMGATIEMSENGTPPLQIKGADLRGIDYDMPVASAQVKSSLLLAGLFAEGITRVTEPAICRDHTERMLRGFGYELEGGYPEPDVSLYGGGSLQATSIDVPADISSAAFFLVAAAITPGANLTLQHVGVNPTRTGVLEILRQMGADLCFDNECEVGGEPVADIIIRYAPLAGIEIDPALVPLAIDEFPALFVAAACADGRTVLRGAEELRVKESDRLEVMAAGLRSLGVSVETFLDGIAIAGVPEFSGATIDSQGDHRIAMAFAVASLRAQSEITIKHCQNVATSFPGFVKLANKVGLKIKEISH
ncbi:MAG: bifunctional prephenate dehydrogenase/3-phosphoshikimate 1-carboxyvinyltransferase [Gammaproteobacteria bacterium]|nr:bifunctional prephenate dehydrogenase/3-phosphoshikimate 1-carboxyvinyltransferase [Gammaproteobacteria bacterium]